MKDLGRFKLFGLLIFLSLVLVFAGVNFLEGKKPASKPGNKPPKWDWKVEIPNVVMAIDEDCNLYGNPHGNKIPEVPGFITYENNEFVEAKYWTYEDRDTGEFHSIFALQIENTEKDISNSPGHYSIGFQNVHFYGCKSYCYLGGEGPCRCFVFPNNPQGQDCSGGAGCDPCGCTGPESEGYWVMKNFMEQNNHPCYGYEQFQLRFWVYTDIEAMEEGETWVGDGYMWRIMLWNTGDTLMTGYEKYHNITTDSRFPLENVEVFKSGENEWIITVDQCGTPLDGACPPSEHGISGRYVVFNEKYYQGVEKQKGKSGRTYIDAEYRKAVGAATAFKFITKWTRY
jgi:hypothetical protein